MSRHPENVLERAADILAAQIRAKHLSAPDYMNASAYDCPECGHPNPAHVCQEIDRHETDAHDDRSDIK